MKTFFTLLLLITFSITNAQSNYQKGMEQAFEIWKNQKNDEAANLFERIALAEKENWLPFYYAAQIKIIGTFETKDKKSVIPNLEKAQDLLNQAKTWSQNNVEIIVLQAMLHTGYVAYDGQTYGPTLASKVQTLYEKAISIEPINPRANLNLIEWKMGSARFFGKDPSVYCKDLDKVIALFDNENNSEEFHPNWGRDRAENIVNDCKK